MAVEFLDYNGLQRYTSKMEKHIHNEDLKRVDVDDCITFDEIDDEDSNNNESIGEIFKQTADLIKSIK